MSCVLTNNLVRIVLSTELGLKLIWKMHANEKESSNVFIYTVIIIKVATGF